jgi:hypothetical protein
MSGNVTLEQVEQLAMQLPAIEQLKLVARISEQLSRSGVAGEEPPLESVSIALSVISPPKITKIGADKSLREADKLLRELDSIAESIGGEFDSGLEIREIREDRSGQL